MYQYLERRNLSPRIAHAHLEQLLHPVRRHVTVIQLYSDHSAPELSVPKPEQALQLSQRRSARRSPPRDAAVGTIVAGDNSAPAPAEPPRRRCRCCHAELRKPRMKKAYIDFDSERHFWRAREILKHARVDGYKMKVNIAAIQIRRRKKV